MSESKHPSAIPPPPASAAAYPAAQDAETQTIDLSGPATPYSEYPHLIKTWKPFFPSSFKPFFSRNKREKPEDKAKETLKIESDDIPKHYVDEAVKDVVAELKKSPPNNITS